MVGPRISSPRLVVSFRLLNDMAPVFASNNFADLDKYQLGALKSFKSGENVAVLGEAGTGKSFLLSRVIALASRACGRLCSDE